ncbi:MAG: pantoate--beta-alanine ligase, partial [Dehalococcoidia bacterium]
LALLNAAGTEAVFMPEVDEMYPPGADTAVIPGKIAKRLEGAARPEHFRGVATIVLKLFNLTQPHRAYFGQKDAQQVAVIKKMVADLNVPVEIVAMPTVREIDGLAMSSRNSYLNLTERQAATVLYRSLQLAKDLAGNGEQDAEIIKRRMTELIKAEPLADVDYVSIVNAYSLDELDVMTKSALISVAVRIGKTRLIDNVILT